MHIEFFAATLDNAFHVFPSCIVCQGEHEATGEPAGAWCVEFAWCAWHFGFVLQPK